MSHVIAFNAPLTCLISGNRIDRPGVYSTGLHSEPADLTIQLGDVFGASPEDFADAYFTLQVPANNEPVHALERWECQACNEEHWVLIEFVRLDDGHCRLVSARALPLTEELLDDVHYVSRGMEWWLESQPGPVIDRLIMAMLPAFPPDVREHFETRLKNAHAAT